MLTTLAIAISSDQLGERTASSRKVPNLGCGNIVTKLMGWTCAEVLAWVETPRLSQEVSFSDQIPAANNETKAEAGQDKLQSTSKEERSGNLGHKSTSQLNLGGDTKYIGESR